MGPGVSLLTFLPLPKQVEDPTALYAASSRGAVDTRSQCCVEGIGSDGFFLLCDSEVYSVQHQLLQFLW